MKHPEYSDEAFEEYFRKVAKAEETLYKQKVGSSVYVGNRHERRKQQALARRN